MIIVWTRNSSDFSSGTVLATGPIIEAVGGGDTGGGEGGGESGPGSEFGGFYGLYRRRRMIVSPVGQLVRQVLG